MLQANLHTVLQMLFVTPCVSSLEAIVNLKFDNILILITVVHKLYFCIRYTMRHRKKLSLNTHIIINIIHLSIENIFDKAHLIVLTTRLSKLKAVILTSEKECKVKQVTAEKVCIITCFFKMIIIWMLKVAFLL